jgi:hypothetical protein
MDAVEERRLCRWGSGVAVATRWCATSGLARSGPGQASGWVNAFRRFTELKTAAAPYVVIRNNVTLDCCGTFDVRTQPAVVHGSSSSSVT